MKVKDIINSSFLIFDGAMGTMLQSYGLKLGEIPDLYNLTNPEIIKDIHKQYIAAGADIITTNTFGSNRLKLKGTNYNVEDVIKAGVNIAKQAAGEKLVALDIGPTGQMMEPIGSLSFDEAYDIFKEQVIFGNNAGADIILIETISDLYEAKAAVLAAKENTDLPVICTMTFSDNHRTLTGTDTLTMVQVLEGLGVDALGLNCSLGPKELQPILDKVLSRVTVPVLVQPNAGLPRVINGKTIYELNPIQFSFEINTMAKKGANLFGGCCGTTPEYIKELKKLLNSKTPKKLNNKRVTSACSSTKTVILGEDVKIIGERLNPTGKKKLKEALRSEDIGFIISEAIIQKETGSDILDINVGLPEIDEQKTMIKVVRELQGIIDLPLQIDSTKANVLEAACRVYNGKPIINSVNGKASSMKEVFPIAKKYGACIIGLTLDEDGIPKTAEKRVEIAKKIVDTAKQYGIPEENIIIDSLVLTASAEQNAVIETLKVIPLIKQLYNVKTVLGVSNVSFGLPERNILNSTYMAMALAYGLDAPITDTTLESNLNIVKAFRVLSFQDIECKDYLSTYGNIKNKDELIYDTEKDLRGIIISGMREMVSNKTRELLNKFEPMKIIDGFLIPALDIVGEKYEKGEIFLPQLIRSAETVKEAFQVIKEQLSFEESNKTSKGKILLATVKGDIHDIGKNIVKILLENYGYEIIDLGKDVSIEEIINKVKKENIKLVGLSALMTTTVESMEETIKALRENNIDCSIMVGGAVLTQEYAERIGADFYGKDANEAVGIARNVIKN